MRDSRIIQRIYLILFILSFTSFIAEGTSVSQSWLNNPTFDTSENWFFDIVGDQSDVNGTIENGYAKLSVLGDRGNKTFFENGTGWNRRPNENNVTTPDYFDIKNNGWWANHTWDDFEPQLLKVQWHKNFTMDVNMSDYEITEASFEAWINATVVAINTGTEQNDGGVDCINDTEDILDMGNGDYIRFFVSISDVEKNREFELTSFQTKKLGCDSGPITELNDTKVLPLSEETLKFYLEEVLKYNSFNFSITVGFLIWCEDNWNSQDKDYFEDIYMKNLSLSISYEKNVNQFTKISLNQVADKISGENLKIKKANLNFRLKINQKSSFNSKISELIIKINNNKYIEKSKKLIDINPSFQQFKIGGLDVKNYIQKNENISISIEVFLKEDFQLNDLVSILIDDLYLNIDIEEVKTQNWGPLTISLAIAIIVSLAIFGSYNTYFKYSPIERKLRKLRKRIKKNRKVKPIEKIRNRSKIGQSKYSKNIEILKLQEVRPDIQNEAKKIKKNNYIILIWIVLILFLGSLSFISRDIKINNDLEINEIKILNQSIDQQFLRNNNFSNQEYWFENYGLIGDKNVLTTDFKKNKGNILILGEKKDYLVCSGTPNNSETSTGWFNTTNPRIVVKPTRGYHINESGCFASHEWEEYAGNDFEVNARQNAAIQWDKKANILDDMSNYIITNASFKLKVNATVSAPSMGNFQNGYDGVDISVDESTGESAFDIGDYLKFYVFLSNPEKNLSYKVAEFIPKGLGNDSAGDFDFLDDKIIEPEDQEDFIFYLTQVLKTDNHNFTLTLGMEFYCEDDWGTDGDNFDEVYIKECNFSFTYQKLIPKYSSISLNQITDKIPDGNVEILDAKVNLNYSIDSSWPGNLSPFSEFRISINNNTLPRTILLKDFNENFQRLELNAKPYIIKNKSIYFSMELFIGNQFSYDENITILIDQVDLFLSYRYIERPPNLLPIVIGLTIGLMVLLIGIGAYQLYFKYPPLVRKIRKLKKKIRKKKSAKAISTSERNSIISNIRAKKNKLVVPEKEELVDLKTIEK